ncbi:hypothetical protein ACHAXT_009932 [Thalassiosira profunda]
MSPRRAPWLLPLLATALPGVHASPPTGYEVCLATDACQDQFARLGLTGYFYAGDDYPEKGCFLKNNNLYFGTNGTEAEMAKAELPGVRERVWCAVVTEAPTTSPSTGAPTTSPVTGDPTASPVSDEGSVATTTDATASGADSASTTVSTTQAATSEAGEFGSGATSTAGTSTTVPATQAASTGATSTTQPATETTVPATQTTTTEAGGSGASSTQPATEMASTEASETATTEPTSGSTVLDDGSNDVASTQGTVALTPSPTADSTTGSPSGSPTLEPTTASPTTKSPSTAPTLSPVVATLNPTPSPTASPTEPAVAFTGKLSSTPAPVIDLGLLDFDEDTIGEIDSASGPETYEMPISPFTLSLQTTSEEVDDSELTSLVSSHVLEAAKESFGEATVSSVDVDVTPISSEPVRRLQEGLNFLLTSHEFEVSGTTYFADGAVAPTADELDAAVQGSFEGDAGDSFVASLKSVEDPGLQSTTSISVSEEPTTSDSLEVVSSKLGANSVEDDSLVGTPLYVLGIVFGVGALLVAMYVFNTRGKKNERQNEMNSVAEDEIDEEANELPKYIQVDPNESASQATDDASRFNRTCPAPSEPSQYDNATCSIFGSIRDAMTAEPKTEGIVAEQSSQSGSGAQSQEKLNSEDRMHSQDTYRTAVSRLNRNMGTSMGSEPSDNQQEERNGSSEWNLCGKYGQVADSGDVEDGATRRNSSSVQDGMQDADEVSLQTSRISNTSR